MAFAASALAGGVAQAQDLSIPTQPALAFRVQAQLGPAFLLQSRSKAVGHLFKPLLTLNLTHAWRPRWELGGAIVALIDTNHHYRILGVLGTARYGLWQGRATSLGASLGLGAGANADILHEDLNGKAAIAPYLQGAADLRWQLSPAWSVGAQAALLNTAALSLSAAIGRAF